MYKRQVFGWRRDPEIDIRWYISQTEIGVQLANHGDITADCEITFKGLDELRNADHIWNKVSQEDQLRVRKNHFRRLVYAGEQIMMPITNPRTVKKWMNDPAIPALKVEAKFPRSWRSRVVSCKWGKYHTVTETLDWKDMIDETVPSFSITESSSALARFQSSANWPQLLYITSPNKD